MIRCFCVLLSLAPLATTAAELQVSTDFPGGSAQVESLDSKTRTIHISPRQHKDRGWVCWWYLKVSGIKPGETITLNVGNGSWATPLQAAISLDNKTWKQTGPGVRHHGRITYRAKVNSDVAYFAWGPPFVPGDAQKLVDWAAKQVPEAKSYELCRTRAGRVVPALRIHDKASKPQIGIWINARQHAWESGSSWVCRGLVEWLVSNDPRAKSLRQKAIITIVPIMDIDNVAIGAGGKSQVPQDHNRDWSDEPHWASVAAATKAIRQLDKDKRFHLFVDLHNPSAAARNPFLFVSPSELLSDAGKENLQRFVQIVQLEMTGPLKFTGMTRESGPSYDKHWRRISKNWVTEHTNDEVVSVTLETAWNTPHGTPKGYGTVGRQLGQSIERYFRTAASAE